MRHGMKRFGTLLLALALVLGLSATAFAAQSTVTFRGLEEGFAFQPGSEYTASDLFGAFKDVMPGDTLSQTIELRNEATDCDYVNIYLRAQVHDEQGNPLSYSERFENADGKDQAGVDGERDETVATMQDFLAQLTMRIYNGTELIYESSPDQAGALADNVLLGALAPGASLALRVELDVPPELDNRYANRVGEVDWVFLAEGVEYEKLTVHKLWDDNGDPSRPARVRVHLLRDGEVWETVELNAENQWTWSWDQLDERYAWSVEEEPLAGYETAYRTVDNTVFIINHRDSYLPLGPGAEPGQPEQPQPEPVSLSVEKRWADEDNRDGQRPQSVTVTLYDGAQAVDKVTLGDWNGWRYTWENLDGSGDYSVLETGIPKGYTPSYRAADGVVTITNTASLIQTGQRSWPIALLGGLGVLLLACGALALGRKRGGKRA